MMSWWSVLLYWLYVLAWEALTIGGCAYVVFWIGHSGWWFVLAVLLSSAMIRPSTWRGLFIQTPDIASENSE